MAKGTGTKKPAKMMMGGMAKNTKTVGEKPSMMKQGGMAKKPPAKMAKGGMAKKGCS